MSQAQTAIQGNQDFAAGSFAAMFEESLQKSDMRAGEVIAYGRTHLRMASISSSKCGNEDAAPGGRVGDSVRSEPMARSFSRKIKGTPCLFMNTLAVSAAPSRNGARSLNAASLQNVQSVALAPPKCSRSLICAP